MTESEPPTTESRRYDVAFVVAPAAELVDIVGPWGVFEHVRPPANAPSPFRLITVAASKEPLRLSGGMTVTPDATFAETRRPDVVVVPAMPDESVTEELLDWLRQVSKTTTVTLSVCNGAFLLAAAGLLDGRTATCHHFGYASMRIQYPEVTVVRGVRWVDHGNIATAGGLTSGTDLALRVLQRLLGNDAAEQVIDDLEHLGDGWKDPTVNFRYGNPPTPQPHQRLDPVCECLVEAESSIQVEHAGTTHHFCCDWCRDSFLRTPDLFAAVS